LPPRDDLISKSHEEAIMVKPSTTKLSSRGQVVIPEEIRNRLGLEPGAQFVVIGEGDVVVLKALKPPKMREFKALLDKVQKAAKAAGVTPADVEKAIREVRAST
jgi:AbrB family looped-hinge helix DNA binding protein